MPLTTTIFSSSRFTNKLATDEPIEEQASANSSLELTPEDSSESLYKKCTISGDSIAEEGEEEMEVDGSGEFRRPVTSSSPVASSSPDGKYVWRVNLFKSEPYWKGWFENLSKLFLSAPSNGRLLLLAGIDRLDKDLTIGQMQGGWFCPSSSVECLFRVLVSKCLVSSNCLLWQSDTQSADSNFLIALFRPPGKFQMQVLPQCGHAVHEDLPDKVAEAIATYLIRNKLALKKKDFDPTFPCC